MNRHALLIVLATLAGFSTVIAAQENSLHSAGSVSAQVSDKGLFSLVAEPGLRPMRLNAIHHWTLRLTDADGNSVGGARIEVDGGMPGHGHGLPTSPRVSPGEMPGEYVLEGMRFNMSGEWELKLDIDDGARSDRVHLEFVVEDTTGR